MKNESAKPTPFSEQEWLTPTEVAKVLRLAKSTVYHLVETKQLPGVRLGGSVRIPRAELEAYLKRLLTDARRAEGI